MQPGGHRFEPGILHLVWLTGSLKSFGERMRLLSLARTDVGEVESAAYRGEPIDPTLTDCFSTSCGKLQQEAERGIETPRATEPGFGGRAPL